MKQMRILVLGGYGVVGARIVSLLRNTGHTALVAGRDPARADRIVDLREPDLELLRASLDEVDVVVNAAGIEDPAVVEASTRCGSAFVDLTASTGYVDALERLDPPAPVLVSVGLAPGLSTLLAMDAHLRAPGPIDIAVVLGAGDRHGPAAVAWTAGLLGRRFADPDGIMVRNLTRPRAFDLPGLGRRQLYRADFSDQHTLTRDLGDPVRTYLGLDSRAATAALAALTWVPSARAATRLHLPGTDRWWVLARAADRTMAWASGNQQSEATATMAVAAVETVGALAPRVHHLHQVFSIANLPKGLRMDTTGS